MGTGILLDNQNPNNDTLSYNINPIITTNTNFTIEMSVRGASLKR